MAEYKGKLLPFTKGKTVDIEYLYNTSELKIWKKGNQAFLSAQGVTCDSNYKIATLPDGWKPAFIPIPTCLALYSNTWKWAYFGLNASSGDISIGSISGITTGTISTGSAIYGQCTWIVS